MSGSDHRGAGGARPGQKRRRPVGMAPLVAGGGQSSGAGGLVVYSGIPSSSVDKDSDLLCPICFEMFREAHMTKCGHSFCHACIVRCLETSPRCPKCNCNLGPTDMLNLIPNFALEELVAKSKARSRSSGGRAAAAAAAASGSSSSGLPDELQRLLTHSGSVGGSEMRQLDDVIRALVEKRQEMEEESVAVQHTLLAEFLTHLKRRKDDDLMRLKRQCDVIQHDLDSVQEMLHNMNCINNDIKDIKQESADQNVPPVAGTSTSASAAASNSSVMAAGSSQMGISGNMARNRDLVPDGDQHDDDAGDDDNDDDDRNNGFNVFRNKRSVFKSTLPQRRRRMNDHFDDLSSCYYNCRAQDMTFPPANVSDVSFNAAAAAAGSAAGPAASAASGAEAAGQAGAASGKASGGLENFSSCLSKFTRYSRLHPLATLNYATDIFTTASIVSSIEFDKDRELFAIAGVTKRIKVYDYDVILKDMVDIHYPCNEMVCGSKISCISWNSFHKSTLASSDYDCSVIVWDVVTGQRVKTFQEHEKRCWSVDFNAIDTKLLASGSDDSRVKLWSANMNHSVASLEAKANVCCVKFNPSSCYHIAFGSADHCVHYYDLRHTKSPLNIFKGHKKAVSYVKFINSTDLVSASTDSQLKLWNVEQKHCIRSFTGHINEKNFVGLATDGDYITCGSENNGLYMYYKGLSKPLFSFKFDTMRSLLERGGGGGGNAGNDVRKDHHAADDNSNEFVSAVCWRQNSPVVVAANSQGTIKVLELV